jgi:hypothetical protein
VVLARGCPRARLEGSERDGDATIASDAHAWHCQPPPVPRKSGQEVVLIWSCMTTKTNGGGGLVLCMILRQDSNRFKKIWERKNDPYANFELRLWSKRLRVQYGSDR